MGAPGQPGQRVSGRRRDQGDGHRTYPGNFRDSGKPTGRSNQETTAPEHRGRSPPDWHVRATRLAPLPLEFSPRKILKLDN